MKKNIIKIIIFFLIFFIFLFYIVKILWLRHYYPIYYFYYEPKDSIDIAYIGPSTVSQYFNTTLAYNEYGFTTSLFSSPGQEFIFTKYCIEEIEKYQNPSLYIIDLSRVAEPIDTITEEEIRRTTDSMRFSKNRINAINEVLSYKNANIEDYLNYYFSFLKYHNSWNDLTIPDIKRNILGGIPLSYKGFSFDEKTIKIDSTYSDYSWENTNISLAEPNKEILLDLINYIKTKNSNVLFVVPIKKYYININGQINDAIKILEENGLKVINFNTLEDFNCIDYSSNMRNNHLNVYGAIKYTLYFSQYLKENYDLKNHKGDKTYISWDKEYERLKNNFKYSTNRDFEDLLIEYKEKDFKNNKGE